METDVETTTSTSAGWRPHDSRTPFGLIVCGIDGSPLALEAARQAAALAGPNSTIELVAVCNPLVAGVTAGALLSSHDATEALARARAELAKTPARVMTKVVDGPSPARRLIAEGHDADLIVVGRHGGSRLRGILIGSTASELLHRSPVPVLAAVPPPPEVGFPDRIMVAADGPDHPENAVNVATSIAELRGSDVTLFRADWSRRANRPAVREAVEVMSDRTGHKPEEILVGGSAHRLIPHYARDEKISLVITGSRLLKGPEALFSISERVAHECPCSVLVTRSQHD